MTDRTSKSLKNIGSPTMAKTRARVKKPQPEVKHRWDKP